MQDLSSLTKGSLSMGSSMAGGNMISEIPKLGSPGSVSEQTADAPVHDHPEMDLGSPADCSTGRPHEGARPATHYNWKTVK